MTPTVLPVLLFTVRTTLFPSNARVSPPKDGSVEQVPPRVSDNSHIGRQQQPLPSMRGSNPSSNPSSGKDVPSLSAPVSGPGNDGAPSPFEVAAIKRQCAADILSLIPESLARAFFRGAETNATRNKGHNELHEQQRNSSHGTGDNDPSHAGRPLGKEEREELLTIIEHDVLDPFSDAYCNKHVIFAIIEMVLVKLIPELSEHNVSSLMEERGIIPRN